MDRWAILQHPRCSSWTESCSSSERSRLVDDVWRTEVKTAMYRALYSDSDLLKRSEECTGSRAVTATWLPENEPAEWTKNERPTKEKLSLVHRPSIIPRGHAHTCSAGLVLLECHEVPQRRSSTKHSASEGPQASATVAP